MDCRGLWPVGDGGFCLCEYFLVIASPSTGSGQAEARQSRGLDCHGLGPRSVGFLFPSFQARPRACSANLKPVPNESPEKLINTRLWRLLFLACLTGVLVLSLMPAGVRLPNTGWDKSNHLLAFMALALTGLKAHPKRPALLLAGLLVYGGLIEVLQSFTPDRMAEWGDLFADALGLAIGWSVMQLGRLKQPG